MIEKVNNFITSSKGFFISFLVFFIIVSISSQLYDGFNSPPDSGIHIWRKTDGLSQIIHYEENGLKFFDHGVAFNQLDNGGKAVAEFPLPYYLSAGINKLLGHQIWHTKLIWLLFLFFGLFALSKLIFAFTGQAISAIAISHSFFLSKVFTAYAINFLPDSIALSSLFIGLYFWYTSYLDNLNRRRLLLAILFISLAGLIKPFYLIPAISVVPIVFIQLLSKEHTFKRAVGLISPILISLIAVAIWFYWVRYYNDVLYPNGFFLTDFLPFHTLPSDEIEAINKNIKDIWLGEYFYFNLYKTHLVLFILVLAVSLYLKRFNLLFLLGINYVGCFLFLFLMFKQLRNHDYYILPTLFLIPLALSIITLIIKIRKVYFQLGLAVLFFIFFAKNSKEKSIRTREWMDENSSITVFQKMGSILNELGIEEQDHVLVLGDGSPQRSLYFLNRKGWTEYNIRSSSLEEVLQNGPNYLFIPLNDERLKLFDLNRIVYSDKHFHVIKYM